MPNSKRLLVLLKNWSQILEEVKLGISLNPENRLYIITTDSYICNKIQEIPKSIHGFHELLQG